jgi:hypothetical protein
MNLKASILSAGCATAALATALVLSSSNSTLSPVLLADSLNCDLSQYKTTQGLTAAVEQDLLVVTWAGQAGSEVRARYAIENGQPLVRDLAVRKRAASGPHSARIFPRSITWWAACAGCPAIMSGRCLPQASH